MEFNKGRTGSNHFRWDPEGSKERDVEKEKRKVGILAVLQSLVDQKRIDSPSFNINKKFLEEVIKTHLRSFRDLKTGGPLTYKSLMTYFGYDLNYLREQLGLSMKE